MAQGGKLIVSDDDGRLRELAARINELTSGMTDYAGGVRYAITRTLAELERKQRREAQTEEAK